MNNLLFSILVLLSLMPTGVIHKMPQITFRADGIGKVEQWSLSLCPYLVLLNVHVLLLLPLCPVAPVVLCQMLLPFKVKLVLDNRLQEIPQKYFCNFLHPECSLPSNILRKEEGVLSAAYPVLTLIV